MSMLNAINDGSCYGHINRKGPNKGKLSGHQQHARTACETAHGPRTHKNVVRHLCVNDSMTCKRGEDAYVCINPDHIEWNTRSQNTQDAVHNMLGPRGPRSDKGKEHKPHKPRSDKGKKRGPNKPHKQRSDKGKKRGPYKLKTGTSND